MDSQEASVGAGEFKAKCLQLIDAVHRTRTSLVITKHGKPMARLVPVEEEPFSLFGCQKDSVVIHGDIVAGTGEIWEADA
ncbi:MAG: type II toxin-antitoxin system Phd/YefM family antitoxin [Aphanocapsa lilacina HA4352-LM1]|jgi:prevent-host-death family protein|nr:type II toxin-antitoxin system Phd/YefM family antitoxin [Aphanocapsa lilacina HA4352-LM1]